MPAIPVEHLCAHHVTKSLAVRHTEEDPRSSERFWGLRLSGRRPNQGEELLAYRREPAYNEYRNGNRQVPPYITECLCRGGPQTGAGGRLTNGLSKGADILPSAFEPSDHATTRLAQRGLSLDDVEYVVAYGRSYHRAGARHCFLGERDIPAEDRANDRFARLEGTTILLDSRTENMVITAYRNRRGLKTVRRKAKYGRVVLAWSLGPLT